jgi:nicotinamide mononucleotide (NMN) deamidase PncC
MAGTFPPEPLRAIVEEVASLLKARKETISVVETAAGGLISAALLATPGASGFYSGGLTVMLHVLHAFWSPFYTRGRTLGGNCLRWAVLYQVYTLESRVAFAGWTQANIDSYNGPSPDVVSGLAENVRQKLGSTYTVCEVGLDNPPTQVALAS